MFSLTGIIMEEIHGPNEERLKIDAAVDMCDPEWEMQFVQSMVEVDDVSGQLIDPSLIATRLVRGDARISQIAKFIIMFSEESMKQIQKKNLLACAGWM